MLQLPGHKSLDQIIDSAEEQLEKGNPESAERQLKRIGKVDREDATTLTKVALLYERVAQAYSQEPKTRLETLLDEKIGPRPHRTKLLSRDRAHRALDAILANPDEYALEQIGESANKVYEVADTELKQAFVIKEVSYDNSKGEIASTLQLEQATADRDDLLQPTIVDIIPHGDKLYYVMIRSTGVPLMSFLQENIMPKTFDTVIEYLAKIHAASLGEEQTWTTKGRLNIGDKLIQRLEDHNLAAPPEIAIKIIANYSPILERLEDTLWVFNKDAHPGNWILSGSKVTAIDIEDKGYVPLQTDLANLFAYGGYLPDHRVVDEKLQVYVEEFNRHSTKGQIDSIHEFRLTYYNAVIDRALALTGFWSSPERSSMMSEREAVLGNAIEALTRIKNDFQMTYKKHQEAYQNLREALVELQDHVREQRTEREKVVALPLAGTVVEETRIVPLTNNYKFIDDIVAQGEERVDEEVTRYERLTEDQTHHFSFFENILTMLHYRKGDVEKAKNRLYKALMSDRGNSELYAQLGYIFQKQKKAVRAGFFYFFAKLADRNKIVSNCMRIFDYAPEESDDRYDKVMKRVGFKSRARRVYRALEKQGQSDFEFTNPLSGEKLMFTTDQRTTDSLDNVVQLEQFRYKRKSVQVYYQAPQTLQKVA